MMKSRMIVTFQQKLNQVLDYILAAYFTQSKLNMYDNEDTSFKP